jgi:glutamyl-tRNA reductase
MSNHLTFCQTQAEPQLATESKQPVETQQPVQTVGKKQSVKIRVVYCNHESAPIALRERIAFSSAADHQRGYETLQQLAPETEAVIISTCNRIEIYLASEIPRELPEKHDIAKWLSDLHEIPLDDLIGSLVEETDIDSIRHLFDVICSLDSMVLGEAQIVNQVKTAYQYAQESQAAGPLIHALFQDAMRVAADVRSRTKLSDGKISVASVAVGEFGKSIFTRFDDKHVLILGAGEMAEETLRYLKDEGIGQLTVINRTYERAVKISEQWGGQARNWDQLLATLKEVDIVVSTLSVDEPVITKDQMKSIRNDLKDKTLLLLDLGTPRNIDPRVGQLDDNIFLYSIDDLEKASQRNRKARANEIQQAKTMIQQAVERFLKDFYHRQTGPVVAQLREQWHAISREELQRLALKLQHLNQTDLNQVEKSVERIINKLLHPPLETIKDHSQDGTPHALLESVKKLFRLKD